MTANSPAPEPPATGTPCYAPTILGRSAEEIDLGWARVIHAHHDPSLRLPPHEHRHSAFTLVRSGGFRLTWKQAEEDCTQRTAFFKRGGERHANAFGPEGTRSFVIELREQEPGRLTCANLSLSLPEESRALGPGAVLVADAIEKEWRVRDASTPVALQGHLMLLLSHLTRDAHARSERRAPRPPKWLHAIDDALRANPGRPPSLTALAQHVGVDPMRMARTYRRHRGCTIAATTRNVRLDEALRRIRSTEEPIAAIAAALGYFDQAHLTRSFKARFGMTPGRARRDG